MDKNRYQKLKPKLSFKNFDQKFLTKSIWNSKLVNVKVTTT